MKLFERERSFLLTESPPIFHSPLPFFSSQDEKFAVGQRVYNKQYAHLYFQRLRHLSPVLIEQVKKAWPDVPLKKILEVEPGVECAVIGTIYKKMKLKPCVLDEYTKEKSLQPHLAGTKFVSSDDALAMEDEGARMELQGDCLSMGDFVSGICLAVRGVEEEGGHFQVKDVCVPGPAPQKELKRGEEKFVALVSGLNIGEEKQDPLSLQLFVDYITGALGNSDGMAHKITRTVVVGNVIKDVAEVPIHDDKKEASKNINHLKEADMFLTQLASSMPLDIMPGPNDPCNVSMPQQPFHRCLLPGTTGHPNVERVTNPHQFTVDGVTFMGTSGQNVDDIMKFVVHDDRLGAMAATLEWCHSTPTAPDTLPCFPFSDKDPFIVGECPHVYFVGNQPKLETGTIEGRDGQQVKVIALPAFSETHTCTLVNLQDLSCHPITFSVDSLEVLE